MFDELFYNFYTPQPGKKNEFKLFKLFINKFFLFPPFNKKFNIISVRILFFSCEVFKGCNVHRSTNLKFNKEKWMFILLCAILKGFLNVTGLEDLQNSNSEFKFVNNTLGCHKCACVCRTGCEMLHQAINLFKYLCYVTYVKWHQTNTLYSICCKMKSLSRLQ